MTRRLFLLLLICSSTLLLSQAVAQRLPTGTWKIYTSMRTVNQVTYSAQSESFWVATSGGAFRYHRDSADRTLRTAEGLATNSILSIYADAGEVYLGDATGVLSIYTESTGALRSELAISQSSLFTGKGISHITRDGNRLYLATDFGLSIYDLSTKTFISTISAFGPLTEQPAKSVMIFGGKIIVGFAHAIATINVNEFNLRERNNWKVTPLTDTLNLTALGSLGSRAVFGTNSNGIFQFDISDQSQGVVNIASSPTAIRDMMSTAGRLYAATPRGYSSTTDLVTFTGEDLPIAGNDAVTSISSNGAMIAVGTATSGLGIIRQAAAPSLDQFPGGPRTNQISSLFYSQSERRLFATEGQTISVFDPTTENWRNLNRYGLPLEDFRTSLYDPVRGVLWAGAYGAGLIKIPDYKAPTITYSQFKSPSPFSSSVEDPTSEYSIVSGLALNDKNDLGVAYFASDGRGLAITSDGETFQKRLLSNFGQYLSFGSIAADQAGNFWVGTISQTVPPPYGLFYAATNGSNGSLVGGSSGQLNDPNVNALLVDQDDALWVGMNNGLQIISNIYQIGSQTSPNFFVRSVKLLEGQIVRSIVTDGVGNKWVGTESGVFVVSPDGADSVARFTASSSPLVSDQVTAIAIDLVSGEAYIGTQSGVSRVSTAFQEGKTDYAAIRVYPNPCVVSEDLPNPTIYIDNLRSGSLVKIFTLSGRLVATIDATNLGSQASWNGRDESGHVLESGVYIVSATTKQAEQDRGQAKLVIVRR